MIKSTWPFGQKPSKASLDRQAEFSNLMELANEVAAKDPRGLIDVVRLYTRPIQTDFLLLCAQRPLHGAKADASPDRLFMPGARLELTEHSHYDQLDSAKFMVDLGKDPVLTCPWHRDRYTNALATIGPGKESGSWKQDRNHSVVALLPWGIVCVFGGNHSIAAGIIGGQGRVTPCEVWDMTGLLEKVRCDGLHYIEIESSKPICPMHDARLGAVFEIGRLMGLHQVTPLQVTHEGLR